MSCRPAARHLPVHSAPAPPICTRLSVPAPVPGAAAVASTSSSLSYRQVYTWAMAQANFSCDISPARAACLLFALIGPLALPPPADEQPVATAATASGGINMCDSLTDLLSGTHMIHQTPAAIAAPSGSSFSGAAQADDASHEQRWSQCFVVGSCHPAQLTLPAFTTRHATSSSTTSTPSPAMPSAPKVIAAALTTAVAHAPSYCLVELATANTEECKSVALKVCCILSCIVDIVMHMKLLTQDISYL